MARRHVSTTINREAVDFLCEPQQTLLDVLRDELHMTGTKEGCGTGDCGACSVIFDGRLICSCLCLAIEAEGATVETIEGIADRSDLHPLQRRFLEDAALQCGICTPGFLVAAKALLDKNPEPSETEVRFALAGNLCRCTGYDKIIRSVLETAAELRGSASGEGDRQ
ncbi:MAG: (2Fe-2S)-binding protein [Myxococcota bacterium]|nr:(2Fe-2S)-binding protein [Myxococcota bacterium]